MLVLRNPRLEILRLSFRIWSRPTRASGSSPDFNHLREPWTLHTQWFFNIGSDRERLVGQISLQVL